MNALFILQVLAQKAQQAKRPGPWQPGGLVPQQELERLRSGFGEQDDDPIMWFVETYWLKPCSDTLPLPMHGLCNVLPCLVAGLLIVGFTTIMAYCYNPKEEQKKVEKKD